jgi:putative peptidoglycan lipid II flippase
MNTVNLDKSSSQLINILKSGSIITLLFLLIKSFGFIEKVVLANYFGTGDEADAYLVALSFPFSLFIMVEEILGPVLVPYIVSKKDDGTTNYWLRIFRKITVYCLIILLLLSALGIWQSEWIVSHLTPGFSGEKQTLTVKLCQSLFVILIFLGLSSLLTVVFHAYRKFNLPILAHALQKLFIILGIVFLHSKLGIYGAVVGCVTGVIIRSLLLFRKLPISLRNKIPQTVIRVPPKEMEKLLILMFPLLCGVIFSQASSMIDNLVLSKLSAGSIAALSYARKIIDLPILLVPFALGIVLLPYLSALTSN